MGFDTHTCSVVTFPEIPVIFLSGWNGNQSAPSCSQAITCPNRLLHHKPRWSKSTLWNRYERPHLF